MREHNFAAPLGASSGNFSITAPAGPSVVINEIDYDQVGGDTAEYLELKNISGGSVNLDNYTVELVNGSGGGATVYDTIDLPNVSLPAGGYYVICANAATVINCSLDDGPDTDFIQNGAPDAIGLRLSGALVDAISYEGNTGAPYTEGTGTLRPGQMPTSPERVPQTRPRLKRPIVALQIGDELERPGTRSVELLGK